MIEDGRKILEGDKKSLARFDKDGGYSYLDKLGRTKVIFKTEIGYTKKVYNDFKQVIGTKTYKKQDKINKDGFYESVIDTDFSKKNKVNMALDLHMRLLKNNLSSELKINIMQKLHKMKITEGEVKNNLAMIRTINAMGEGVKKDEKINELGKTITKQISR
jgi:hypothetical protein